jgi:hypothetical protein
MSITKILCDKCRNIIHDDAHHTCYKCQLTEAKAEVVLLKAEKRFVCDSRPNLLHLGWAQGNYSNKCRQCETIFTGDKRAGCCADCAWKIETERAEKAEALYQDLIMQVACKFPNESRHETAKRYISERENTEAVECKEVE